MLEVLLSWQEWEHYESRQCHCPRSFHLTLFRLHRQCQGLFQTGPIYTATRKTWKHGFGEDGRRCVRILVAIHSHQSMILADFFVLPILCMLNWFTEAWKNIEYLLACLLRICVSSFVTWLYRDFLVRFLLACLPFPCRFIDILDIFLVLTLDF